ncbi:MAG: D-alanyl-D-alanine carboxypeptidase [Clostridiales bacterium]|nr:D-alanyl-D-alanine carboxypeptidase [Clostridiales bacterium]
MKRCSFIILTVFLCLLCCGGVASAETVKKAASADFSTSAQSAVVMERSSHRVLFEQNADAHLPMASTTKIVTALTVLNHADLDDVVEVNPEAVGIEGSSIYLRAGEHLTVRELLYGLMLRSGNDSAVALALHVAGSIESFAEMMNDTAKQAGCVDSHFVNPHGLHDDEHYTSARDLATLTCIALNNPDFQQIVATKAVRISNEGMDYDRVLVNKNKLLSNFEDADGVKTGYTKKAGRCFVGSATRNGMQVVVVVLNCGPMFEETADLLNAAFNNYHLQCVIPLNKMCGSRMEKGKRVYYSCPQSFSYPVHDGEELTTDINLDGEVPTISAFLNGGKVFERELIKCK